MPTVINNPPPDTRSSDSNVGTIIGLIILAVLAIVFIVYGIPALRNVGGGDSGATINVPDRINVDVTPPQGGATGQ